MLLLTCCTNVDADLEQVSEPTGTVEQDEALGKAAEEEVVTTIYLLDRDRFVSSNIPNYNVFSRKQNRRIEVHEFTMDQKGDMYQKITQEILAGKGPDIIYLNSYTDWYLDIHRLVERGALADLDVLIANDDDFHMEDYNSTVMEAGILDGKRAIMPMSYHVGYLLGIQENFDFHGITLPEHWTMEEYLSILESYYEATSKEPAMLGLHPIRCLKDVINGGDLMEDEFIRMAKIFKEEYIRYRNANIPLMSIPEYFGMYCKNNYLFIEPKLQGGSEFINLYCTYNFIAEQQSHMVILDIPNEYYLAHGFLINNNTKHKDAAFDFIQYMLSEEVQTVEIAEFQFLPVNKQAYESAKTTFVEADYHIGEMLPVSEANQTQFFEIYNGIDNCRYLGHETFLYHNFINGVLLDYYDDKIDEQGLLDSIRSKLFIYSTE